MRGVHDAAPPGGARLRGQLGRAGLARRYRIGAARSPRRVLPQRRRPASFLVGGYDLAGWGDAGYRDAVAKAQSQAPGSTLSDVRADLHFINILVWRQECLVVTAAAR